jgi:hypothetical protein
MSFGSIPWVTFGNAGGAVGWSRRACSCTVRYPIGRDVLVVRVGTDVFDVGVSADE